MKNLLIAFFGSTGWLKKVYFIPSPPQKRNKPLSDFGIAFHMVVGVNSLPALYSGMRYNEAHYNDGAL